MRNLKTRLIPLLIVSIISTFSFNINTTSKTATAATAATTTVSADSTTAEPMAEYKISVQLNSTEKTLTGSETVAFTNKYNDSLNTLCLHLYPDSFNQKDTTPAIGTSNITDLKPEEVGYIEVSNVKVNGKTVEFSQDKQLLKATLLTPLSKNETATISMDFKVKIPLGTDRLGYTNDVYSITNWYPILSMYNQTLHQWDENQFHPIGESNYSDVADYSVSIQTPSDMVIASTGKVIGTNITGKEKITKINSHQTRDFVFMMSNKYKSLSSSWNNIDITSYYIASKENPEAAATAKHLLGVVMDSLKFYSEKYGKYPYPELKIAETYLEGGAMEYPALIQMGQYNNIDKESLLDHSSWLEDAAAHETGHQWWYAVVGNNEFLEPMMDESLNTFSTAYYFEKRFGKSNQNSLTLSIRNKLSQYTSKPVNSSVDAFTSWNDYQKIIYNRGSELFEDLMLRIGEDKFIKVLKTYYDRYKFQNGSVSAFADVLGEIAGTDIRSYFFSAVNNKDYMPSNISLSTTELRQLKNFEEISDLQFRETSLGINISSIILRGLKGEKITFVLPSKAPASVESAAASYATKLKISLQETYNIKIDIKKDNAISENQKTSNLILLGNNESNLLIKQFKSELPLKINSKDATIENAKTALKNLSAIYAVKNPKNTKNILLVIYWKENLKKFDILGDNYDQYIIHYSTDNEIRGNFN